jgi:hypothetical protein
MSLIELEVDEALLRDARRHAAECGTSLEALLTEHLVVLADRAGRRLALREQIYSDYRPPEEVVEALRAEGLGQEGKTN